MELVETVRVSQYFAVEKFPLFVTADALRRPFPSFLSAYLQVASDGFLSFGLGAGQLLPQHLLPHVDGLQRLLDVEEVLLKEPQTQTSRCATFSCEHVTSPASLNSSVSADNDDNNSTCAAHIWSQLTSSSIYMHNCCFYS